MKKQSLRNNDYAVFGLLQNFEQKKKSIKSFLKNSTFALGFFAFTVLGFQTLENKTLSQSLEKKIQKIEEKADQQIIFPDDLDYDYMFVTYSDNKNVSDYLDKLESRPGDIALVVDKKHQTMQKYLLSWNMEKEYLVSTGENPGDKKMAGDKRTPEGKFEIKGIENSSGWEYEGEKAYGPKFLRLDTGNWNGIGIHGTNEPEKLGSPASHGCIRMDNNEVYKLSQEVKIGTPVMIYNY